MRDVLRGRPYQRKARSSARPSLAAGGAICSAGAFWPCRCGGVRGAGGRRGGTGIAAAGLVDAAAGVGAAALGAPAPGSVFMMLTGGIEAAEGKS